MKNNTFDRDKFLPFEKSVLEATERYSMLEPCDRVLVGLSGGADSVSLLVALHELVIKKALEITLCACHVNHMIRGKEADADELFANKLCESLGIPFYCTRIDIPSICQTAKGSTELVAREKRYAYFDELCSLHRFTKIATAHTLSDNAETLIFNICRGASADGLCGIPPKRGNIIRPLCLVTRADVEEYLGAKGQDFCKDATNESDDYTRNFIRHKVIPELKRINPSLEQAAGRLCDSARCDKEYFDGILEKKEGLSVIDIDALPQAVKLRYIKRLCKEAFGEGFFLSAKQLDAIESEIKSVTKGEKRSSELSLCDKKQMRIAGTNLTFCDVNIKKNKENDKDFNYFLNEGKNIINEEYAIILSHTPVTQQTPDNLTNADIVYKLYKQTSLPSDIILGRLYARSRRFGDSYRADGMTRKVKKMLIDRKYSENDKASLPIICDECGIVYIPDFPLPDRIKAHLSDTDKRIHIAIYRRQSNNYIKE